MITKFYFKKNNNDFSFIYIEMSKWNLLPDDVINRIYKFKHQLDMKESLRTIQRFKYRKYEHSNVFFKLYITNKRFIKI
jgi:hypothetical protein